MPKDPVTGQRVWRNNKASAAGHGFIMDNSVKDQLPTAEEPTPQVMANFKFFAWCLFLPSFRFLKKQNNPPNCKSILSLEWVVPL